MPRVDQFFSNIKKNIQTVINLRSRITPEEGKEKKIESSRSNSLMLKDEIKKKPKLNQINL